MLKIMKTKRMTARCAALLCAAVLICLFYVPQKAYATSTYICDPQYRASLWQGEDRTDTTQYRDSDGYVKDLHLSVSKDDYREQIHLDFVSKTRDKLMSWLDAGFTLVVTDKEGRILGKFYDHCSCFLDRSHYVVFNSSDCIDGFRNAIKLFYDDYLGGGSEYRIYIESVSVNGDAVSPADDWGITQHPVDQTAAADERATFTITTFGSGLSYQWYIDRNDGKGWKVINGANGTAYVTSAVNASCDGYRYYCKVTNPEGGEMDSAAAVLHVSALPDTGDPSLPMLWLGLGLASAAGALLLLRKKHS